jgi:S1-C subfamily serine protease
VFFVETLDDEGAPAVGSAFVVGSDGERSLLVTSLATVASSTTAPGPPITVRQGNERLDAELWSWDVDSDLALLTVAEPELTPLPWASDEQVAKAVGSGVFVVGGLGGAGATAVPGLVVDQSSHGFQHTAAIGNAYPGGPILTSDGKVLGVASLAYQPLGFDPGDVHFSVPVSLTCSTVLTCGAGGPTTGASGGAAVPTSEASPADDADTGAEGGGE